MIIASLYPCPFDVQDRHDYSASILKDGQVYAYEEDKISGVKNEGITKFPERSLFMGLKELNLLASDVNYWVFPTPAKVPNLEDMYLFFTWFLKAYGDSVDKFEAWYKEHVFFVDHQMSHAALAVLSSNFQDCAFLCQDGGGDKGDQRDCIFGEYRNGEFQLISSHHGLNTICSLHAFITDASGLSENGKTSGIAAYGEDQPQLREAIEKLITIEDDGIVFKRERYSKSAADMKRLKPDEYSRIKIINQCPSDTNIFRHSLPFLKHDIAATGELIVRRTFLQFLGNLRKRTSLNSIVFSGGLFQNVALNNAILESGLFGSIFCPMSPSDGGLSLGAALYIENQFKKRERRQLMAPYLGPSFRDDEIQELLNKFRLNYSQEQNIERKVAELIAEGCVVGWFQGRGEYGLRSLGSRSILADPRSAQSKSRVNQLLKKRDWFMPYAPAIPKEEIADWVEHPCDSPYMQIAFQVRKEKQSLIPAAVHVDGSSRVQTVDKHTNPLFWSLLQEFRKITGIPVILNTSFNRHGIPTIATPRRAVEHLLEGCMDYLAIGPFLIGFSENRVASPPQMVEKPEAYCLAEDNILRLDQILQGTDEQIESFIEALSKHLGFPMHYDNRIIHLDGQEIPLESASAHLLKKLEATSC